MIAGDDVGHLYEDRITYLHLTSSWIPTGPARACDEPGIAQSVVAVGRDQPVVHSRMSTHGRSFGAEITENI